MKKLFSISELERIGYSKAMLYELVHTKGFPCYQAKTKNGRGKFRINIDELEHYMCTKGIKKGAYK